MAVQPLLWTDRQQTGRPTGCPPASAPAASTARPAPPEGWPMVPARSAATMIAQEAGEAASEWFGQAAAMAASNDSNLTGIGGSGPWTGSPRERTRPTSRPWRPRVSGCGCSASQSPRSRLESAMRTPRLCSRMRRNRSSPGSAARGPTSGPAKRRALFWRHMAPAGQGARGLTGRSWTGRRMIESCGEPPPWGFYPRLAIP